MIIGSAKMVSAFSGASVIKYSSDFTDMNLILPVIVYVLPQLDFATQLSYAFLLPEVQCNVNPQLKCYTT